MNRPPVRPVRPPRWELDYYRARPRATLIDRWHNWRERRRLRTWIGWRWSVVTYHVDICRRRLRIAVWARRRPHTLGLAKRARQA